MPKDHSDVKGDGLTADVHLVLNGKGGVGKSVVATWLAEFLVSRGRSVRCIDGDPVNRSFSQYKALGAEKLVHGEDEGSGRSFLMLEGTPTPRCTASITRLKWQRHAAVAACEQTGLCVCASCSRTDGRYLKSTSWAIAKRF